MIVKNRLSLRKKKGRGWGEIGQQFEVTTR
jgi:hypothetical protein